MCVISIHRARLPKYFAGYFAALDVKLLCAHPLRVQALLCKYPLSYVDERSIRLAHLGYEQFPTPQSLQNNNRYSWSSDHSRSGFQTAGLRV